MDDRMIEKNDEIEIDLQRIWNALLSKAWLIAIVAVLCAVVTLVGIVLFVTPTYESSIMMYVNNASESSGTSDSISSADISASRAMVKSYVIILRTKETLEKVIEYADVDRTYAQVKGMITAGAVNSTEIIKVIVTSPDPKEAETIANAIAAVLPSQINSIIDGTSARIVETASVASEPSSPSYMKNTVIGGGVGFLAIVLLITLQVVFDTTVRTEVDATLKGKNVILATVPDMLSHSKGGYYYGYRQKYYTTANKPATDGKVSMIGADISFSASEAYKLLRTKLQFSFTDEKQCHVIGISSAMTGEGKSLTAVNLAFAMSQLGKRVLLIDCDMRRPSVAGKLPIEKHPGLSDYLSGQTGADKLIQFCGLEPDPKAFHVISAGRIPPNPMELLSSNKMEKTISQLNDKYDYIILDLPPVGEVGDALAVAKMTDGILLVVRQDYCNRMALNAAIHQFEFVDAKILGVVLNCANEEAAGYGYKYYKRYNRKYYKAYRSYYAAAESKHRKTRQEQG